MNWPAAQEVAACVASPISAISENPAAPLPPALRRTRARVAQATQIRGGPPSLAVNSSTKIRVIPAISDAASNAQPRPGIGEVPWRRSRARPSWATLCFSSAARLCSMSSIAFWIEGSTGPGPTTVNVTGWAAPAPRAEPRARNDELALRRARLPLLERAHHAPALGHCVGARRTRRSSPPVRSRGAPAAKVAAMSARARAGWCLPRAPGAEPRSNDAQVRPLGRRAAIPQQRSQSGASLPLALPRNFGGPPSRQSGDHGARAPRAALARC